MRSSIKGSSTALPAWRLAMWGSFAAILLLPLIAMQFTAEVRWTATDFIAAALLLGATGLAYEGLARLRLGTALRMVSGLGIAAALLIVWIDLAVGIF